MNSKKIIRTRLTELNYYGWIIVFIGAVGLFFSGPGQTYSVSIFINTYIKEFGWSRSLISSFYSASTLLAGFLLPIIGGKIDSVGHRKMFVAISSLLSLTCLWMSFVTNRAMLIIGFLFLRLFGQGSMTLLSQTLVPQWFIKRRGMALSLTALGGVLGSALIPLLNNWIIINKGAVFTWRVLALMLVTIMVPLAWILIRNKPEDIGAIPDGIKHGTNSLNEKLASEADSEEKSWTLSQAMKTRAFWLMLFCMAVPSMIITGLTFHIVSIMEMKGFSSTFAATILGIVAIVQFPCTFIAGYAVDKIKVRYVKAVNYLVLILAMFLIIYGKTSITLRFYGVLVGIFMGFDSVSTGVLWPNYFGRKHLGSIRGVAMTSIIIGSSLGPLPFGFAYDMFNSYRQIITIMMAFPMLAGIASLMSPPPKYKQE